MDKTTGSSCRDTCQKKERCLFMEIELSELSKYSSLHFYHKNQIIFSQGKLADGVFCINSGKVKVVITTSEGKESIVRIVSSGDILGHRALFGRDGYHASAIALEDTQVCFFEQEFIFNAVYKHRSLSLNLLTQLSNLVGTAEARNATFIHKNVRERLAEFLHGLRKLHGVQEGHFIRLEIKLTREEMASTIGTTRETLARLLTEFKNEGIILQMNGMICITNEKKLIEFANF